MNLKKLILKGGLQLGATQAVSQASTFLRNLIVARIVGPADFGIASTFAITMALLEMVGSLSADKLLIQAEDGDHAHLQGVAHLMLVGRGLLAGIVVFCCAGLVSDLFGAPGAAWAFRCLALVPVVRGLIHLDMYRIQREMNFGAAALVDMIANLAGVIAAWPVAACLRDYSAMLWLIVGQALIAAVASHRMAKRGYSVCWHLTYASRVFDFGWPLMINSVLMFIIFQGDRFVVGSAGRLFHAHLYSLEDLGGYSVALALTLSPCLLIGSISSTLLLPLLSRCKNDRSEFCRQYAMSAEVLALVCGVVAVPMVAAGGWLVTVMYGARYTAGVEVIGWLAAAQAVRIIRVTPTLVAMANGDTKNGMISNVFRSISLPVTLLLASRYAPLWTLAAIGFGGECVALFVSLWRVQQKFNLPFSLTLKPAAITGLALILSGISCMTVRQSHPALEPACAIVIVSFLVCTMLLNFSCLRTSVQFLFAEIFRFARSRSVLSAFSSGQ